MNKSTLRQFYRQKRQELHHQEITVRNQQILKHLQALPIWEFQVYHLYVSMLENNEVNTFPLMNYLFDHNKTVVVPKINGFHLLNCQIQRNVVWQKANFGVSEPVSFAPIDNSLIEVVFVPMLIGDRLGHRIGYGGGFYDRFLANLPESTLKIGLSFFSPIDSIKDIEITDIPLDYSVSPETVLSFKR